MDHEKIQEIIKKHNVKIDDLVSSTGLNKSTLSKIIYGVSKNPGINNIYAIAKALDCSIYDFYDEPVRPRAFEKCPVPVFSEFDLEKTIMNSTAVSFIEVPNDSIAAFGIKIERGDMEPSFQRGEIIPFCLFPESEAPEVPHGKVVLASLGGARPEIVRVFSVFEGVVFLHDNVKETEPAFYPFNDYFNSRVKILGEAL